VSDRRQDVNERRANALVALGRSDDKVGNLSSVRVHEEPAGANYLRGGPVVNDRQQVITITSRLALD
jgi:hypothetical protein